MNSEKDIREIIGSLKSYLFFNKEMGLEPPQLSSTTLEYLTNGIRKNNKIVDEYIETSSDNKGVDCNCTFKCIKRNKFNDDEFKLLYKIVKDNRLIKERLDKMKKLLNEKID